MSLQQWLPAQDAPEVPVNENFSALEHMAVYAKDATTTTGLTWGYLGGRWGGFTVAAATVALAANSTQYITVERGTGVLSVSSSNASWNNTELHARVYKLTTGGATVTAVEDHRAGIGGVHGVGSASVDLRATVNVFTRNQSVEPRSLASGASIAIDASQSNIFSVTLTANTTLTNPANLTDGMELSIVLRQDAVGGRLITFGDQFKWAGGAAPVFSSAPYAVDIVRAQYDAGTGFLFCSARTGFDATPVAAAILPAISGNNETFNDEGDSATGWTATGCTLAAASSWLRATKTTAAGTGASASKSITFTPSNSDFILYIRARASAAASGDTSFIWMLNGSKEISISLNRHYSSGYVAGTVSMNGTTGASTQNQAVVATGLDIPGQGVDLALQFDSKRSALICWFRESDGRWKFKGRVACDWFSSTTISLLKGSTAPVNSWVEIDFLTLAKPNLVAIGDSICEGKTLFSPDRSLALTNDESTWMRHAPIYQGLRNNLIVNKGVGSETSSATLARINDAAGVGAKVVFLHASSNDAAQSITQPTRTSNISSMVAAINSAGAEAVLLNAMYGTSGMSGNPAHRDYMKTWWDTNKESVGAFSAIDVMQPLLSGGFMGASYTQSDGIHPNPSGYGLMGALISEAP